MARVKAKPFTQPSLHFESLLELDLPFGFAFVFSAIASMAWPHIQIQMTVS